MGKQYTSDQVTRRRFSPPAVSNSIVCIGPHSIQLGGHEFGLRNGLIVAEECRIALKAK